MHLILPIIADLSVWWISEHLYSLLELESPTQSAQAIHICVQELSCGYKSYKATRPNMLSYLLLLLFRKEEPYMCVCDRVF